MTKQINLFFLLAIMTVFTACNNANKPAATVKEQDASTMSNEEIPMSDVQIDKNAAEDIAGKSGIAAQKVANKTASKQDVQKANTKTIGDKTTANNAPMNDADKLRQKFAEKKADIKKASNNGVNVIPEASKEAAKNKEAVGKATIKNAKVTTPTVTTPTQEAPKKMDGAPAHDDWNALLTANVSSTGKVNYKGFKAAQGKLDAYLKKLKSNPPASSWSRNEKMAFWINAYNAFTIKKIVDNYPLGSIQELSGGKVWDDKWINIGDKTYSLNEIENGILRPIYKDARIHFAVNCAAKSCPSLHNRAFTAGNLESKLASLTKKFVNNADFNTITASKVTVSKIFDWYGSDFGDLKGFLNKYSNTPINADAAIDYTEYNWSLNE